MGQRRQLPRTTLSIACLLAARSFDCAAFTIPTFLPSIPNHAKHPIPHQQRTRYPINTSLQVSKAPPLPDTTDPFLLLGISPTTDPKEIKRAYRKRAMQYHPDVLLTADSTEEDRKRASDDFARINAAYEMLSGNGKGVEVEKKASSGGYSYQPPHRRPSSGGSYGKSTNWEDYMPNYREEDAKYDAGGDSFGAIFSDLLTGVAAGAAGVAGMGGGGIMGDLIDFLERNVDGFQSGYDDDTSLERLLVSGSFDEVANEMDETDVLVTSLEKKLLSLEDEMMQLNADLGYATKYIERIDLEERIAELKAREKVVKGYLKKGRSRLVRLRERYKELIVQGRGGRAYESSSSSATSRSSSSQREAYHGQSQQSSSTYGPIPSPSPAPNRAEATPSTTSDGSKSWRNESFGGTGRRSSSSRRSSRRKSEATSDSSSGNSDSFRTTMQSETRQRNTSEQANSSSLRDSTAGNSSVSRPTSTKQWTPPHRRSQSSTQQVAEEKRRLRELQVDDEFERLKREMGI